MGTKAGQWLRVSSNGQDEESQRPDVQRWCDSHDYESCRTYVVHGKSAYHGNKQFDAAWASVLDDMRAGEIEVLVVWKQDRIDRKLETFQMLAKVVEAGGRVEFVTQPHLNDLTTMGGRISLKVQEEIAYAESKDKSDRVKIKQAANRARGSINGRAPWGYRITGQAGRKVLAPTDDGTNYTPLIFQRIIDGDSLRDVAAWLTSKGVPTNSGNAVWHEAFIGNRLIRNTVYYGKRVNGGALETPALVPYSTWKAANDALASRVRPGRSTASIPKAYLRPVCGNPDCDATCTVPEHRDHKPCSCPSPMYRVQTGTPGKRVDAYRCTGRGPQRKGCGNLVTLTDADNWVNEAMVNDHGNQHMDRQRIPGDDRSEAIQILRDRAMDAYRDGDKARFMELDAEADAMDKLPSIPAHWEEIPTGISEGDYFASLTLDQQREELAKRWEISLTREGAVIGPKDW